MRCLPVYSWRRWAALHVPSGRPTRAGACCGQHSCLCWRSSETPRRALQQRQRSPFRPCAFNAGMQGSPSSLLPTWIMS